MTGKENQNQKVHVYPSDQQLSLAIASSDQVRRFAIIADFDSQSSAPSMIGVKKEADATLSTETKLTTRP